MRQKWLKVKNKILGSKYDLSVALVDDLTMRELNRRYRKKPHPANVLSFPLSNNEGEILINKRCAKNKNYASYLFVHSLLHLKGLRHGEKMRRAERKYEKIFGNMV